MVFPSFSMANERLSPKTPASVKAIHKMAGIPRDIRSTDKSKAKLNITVIKREKVNMDSISSLVLSSVTISFQTIAHIPFIASSPYAVKVDFLKS